MKFKLALLCGLAMAGANAMACYTVYDGKNRVIYQGLEAPVDMSQPLHQTLGKRYPGAHMVFNQAASCSPVPLAQVPRPTATDAPVDTIRLERSGRTLSPQTVPARSPSSSSAAPAPLLTDRGAAQRNGLPYTVVAGDIVVVPGAAAARVDLPSFTVLPSEPVLAEAPPAVDTRVMGAGPAAPVVANGVRRPSDTVITEMRDGTTIVQTVIR